jgi:hypothetical protein
MRMALNLAPVYLTLTPVDCVSSSVQFQLNGNLKGKKFLFEKKFGKNLAWCLVIFPTTYFSIDDFFSVMRLIKSSRAEKLRFLY